MMNLTFDIWNFIISLLESNRDKFCLLMITTEMMKCQVSFNEAIDNKKIIGSRWYDFFYNIVINSSQIDNSIDIATLKIPSKTKHLTFRITDSRLPRQNRMTDSYFHGTCAWSFNGPNKEYIKKNILSTIESITFSVRYVEPILNILQSDSDFYLDKKIDNAFISSNEYYPFIREHDGSFTASFKYPFIVFPLDDGKVSMYVEWIENGRGIMKPKFFPHSKNYLTYYSN